MSDHSAITWTGGMGFNAEVEGTEFGIDAAPQFGGQGGGPKPKTLMLTALAGCTGMDVVSILRKMRMPFDSLNIAVDGELTDDHPKVYKKIHIHYRFGGDELDQAKIEKAVKLSQERYCGVTVMLAKTAEISFDIDLQAS